MNVEMKPPAQQAEAESAADTTIAATHQALIKAISNLPGRSGRERMELFIQATLMALEEGMHPLSRTLGLEVELSPKVFQFRRRRFDKNVRAALELAAATYVASVVSCPCFTDLLSYPFATIVGAGENGQNFTPWDLALLTAGLAYDHETRHGKRLERLADPCCGAGALPLARLHTLYEREGPIALIDQKVCVNDIDPLCAAMAGLQLLANQLLHWATPEVVQVSVGNALVGGTQVAMRTERVGWSIGSLSGSPFQPSKPHKASPSPAA